MSGEIISEDLHQHWLDELVSRVNFFDVYHGNRPTDIDVLAGARFVRMPISLIRDEADCLVLATESSGLAETENRSSVGSPATYVANLSPLHWRLVGEHGVQVIGDFSEHVRITGGYAAVGTEIHLLAFRLGLPRGV